jgi:hypothetical protein
MIFAGSGTVRHYPLENGCDGFDAHFQPGLLANLPPESFFEALAGFDCPSGKGPIPGERLLAAFDEQDTAGVQN